MKQIETMKFSIIVRNNDFIIRDYQLYQNKLIPSMSFLDVICRFLVSKGFSLEELVLKNIFFKYPTIINDNNDVKISVGINWEEELGYWNIKASASEILDDGNTVKPVEVMTAELHRESYQPASSLDIRKLIDSSVAKEDNEELYHTIRKQGLYHGDYMKLSTQLYDSKDWVIGEGKISTLANRYVKNYYIHPAFLDGALTTGFACKDEMRESINDSKNAYVIMYIESFKVLSPLSSDECYLLYRKDENINTVANGILYVSVEVYDKQNNLTAIITKASFKEAMSENQLKVLLESKQGDRNTAKKRGELAPLGTRERKIQEFLLDIISKIMDCEKEKIDIDEDFFYIGLNSSSLLELVKELEIVMEDKIYPTVFFENSTIRRLSKYLDENFGKKFDVI